MRFPTTIFNLLPNACLLAWGWQRRLFAGFAGAVAAFSLPPYGAIAVLPVAFPCLIWLMDGAVEPRESLSRRFRTGLSIGWWFGFGYFLSGLWWIGAAFLVDAEKFAWLMPFAVLAMPAGLALFPAIALGLAALMWSDRFQRVLILASALSLSDWVRGHVLSGFPWNAFGYTIADSLVLAQTASLVGVFGLSFLAVAIFSMPAVLADARPLASRASVLAFAATGLVAMLGFGLLRLSGPDPEASDLDIRIVQPSIVQSDKWLPEMRDANFRTLLDLTGAPLGGDARVGAERLVVWPESAVPFLLTQEPGALVQIGRALGPNDQLAVGAVRAEMLPRGLAYFNSIYVVATDGEVVDVYDKVHLVPFGEYLPLKSIIENIGISNIVGAPEGFTPGYRMRPMSAPAGLKFLPLICYEAIFPDVSRLVAERPAMLLNVTNDAWFGDTPGPYQHFAQARMRSIETGLPLIRAANTGISAIVNGKGKELQRLELYTRGVLDGRLPMRVAGTTYNRYGDLPYLITLTFVFIFWGVTKYNRDSRIN